MAARDQSACPLWVISAGDNRDDAAGHVRFTPKADKHRIKITPSADTAMQKGSSLVAKRAFSL
jgi:hypothetical protein